MKSNASGFSETRPAQLSLPAPAAVSRPALGAVGGPARAGREIGRRETLRALGAAALTACSRKASSAAQPLVSIVRAAAYGQDLFDTVRRILSDHRVDVRGKRVVLKPNLVEFDSGTTINTHPLVVHAAIEAFRALGAASVRIAEGPGHRRITLDLADAAGYFRIVPGFESLFTDLNLDDVTRVELARPRSKLDYVYLPNTVLSCDLLVSMPKMKTHHWVGATLSMKNLFGIVPGAVYGWPKNVLHWAGINECIADLHTLIPHHFCIVDGIDGMEGNGPIQGSPKHAGVLVAGKDMVAVDSTACRVMGIDPAKVDYLRLADRNGALSEQSVRQIGERIQEVRTAFRLIPEFQSIRLPNG
jgi:uncharacterized protein (DUF362 family)